jgi:hypothetical protein
MGEADFHQPELTEYVRRGYVRPKKESNIAKGERRI